MQLSFRTHSPACLRRLPLQAPCSLIQKGTHCLHACATLIHNTSHVKRELAPRPACCMLILKIDHFVVIELHEAVPPPVALPGEAPSNLAPLQPESTRINSSLCQWRRAQAVVWHRPKGLQQGTQPGLRAGQWVAVASTCHGAADAPAPDLASLQT